MVDLVDAAALGIFSDSNIDVSVFNYSSLNGFASLGQEAVQAARSCIQKAFGSSSPSPKLHGCLVPVSNAQMHLPFVIGDYTDFLCSKVHSLNMSKVMTGEERLFPGFLRHPVAYHGRSSSVVVSGTPVVRPIGTIFEPAKGAMRFGSSEQLDFEVEMVCVQIRIQRCQTSPIHS